MIRVLLALGLVVASGKGAAAGEAVTTQIDIDYVSRYVWRGLVASAEPALQPSLTFTHKSGTSFSTWASIGGDRQSLGEIDYTLSHSWMAAGNSLSAGLIGYTFPNTSAPSTAEVYAAVAGSGNWKPSLGVYYDFDQASGWYAAAGIARGFPVSSPRVGTTCLLSAKLGYGSSGYNRCYFGSAAPGLVDLALSASITVPMEGRWSVTPSLTYSRLADENLRQSVDKPDNLVLGVRLTTGF